MIDPDLIEYNQKVYEIGNDPAYEQVQFDQLNPVLVKKRKGVRVVHQFGRAIGWKKYVKAPEMVIEGVLLEQPEIRRDRLDPLHFETTWSYIIAIADDAVVTPALIAQWQAYPAGVEYEP